MVTVTQRICQDIGIRTGQWSYLMHLANNAEKAQTNWHNGEGTEAAADIQIEAVENYAKRLGFDKIEWPGLYPIFFKNNRMFECT